MTLNIDTHLDWSNKKSAVGAMESVVKVPEKRGAGGKWESK